jgi:sec-independent protein translocase protein TatC
MSVREHLQELGRRLLYPLAILIAGSILAYVVREPIIAFLRHPLGQPLYYTSPTGSFEFVMQICLLVGFLLALPVLCYNLIRFIEPALSRPLSRRGIAGLLLASYGLSLTGAAFGYYLSLPAALHFFGLIGTSNLQPLISVNQYLSFLLGHLATFAALFQLPLILLFINRFTPLTPAHFSKARKFVIVGAFALALIIPAAPDPLSQTIIAFPIIGLYELSSVLVWLANARRRHHPVPEALPPPQRTQPPAHTPPAPSRPVPRPQSIPHPQSPRPQSQPPRPQPVRRAPTPQVIDLRNHQALDLRSASESRRRKRERH